MRTPPLSEKILSLSVCLMTVSPPLLSGHLMLPVFGRILELIRGRLLVMAGSPVALLEYLLGNSVAAKHIVKSGWTSRMQVSSNAPPWPSWFPVCGI